MFSKKNNYVYHYQLLVVTCYIINLLSIIALLICNNTLTAVDNWLLWSYIIIGNGIIITSRFELLTTIQFFHILFTIMFFLTPVFARTRCVFAVHLVVVLLTLSLRAECEGECPVNTMESDSSKIYNESLINMINFNVYFLISGFATLVRWLQVA